MIFLYSIDIKKMNKKYLMLFCFSILFVICFLFYCCWNVFNDYKKTFQEIKNITEKSIQNNDIEWMIQIYQILPERYDSLKKRLLKIISESSGELSGEFFEKLITKTSFESYEYKICINYFNHKGKIFRKEKEERLRRQEEEKRIEIARQEAERKAELARQEAELARQEAERKAEEEKRIALARQEAERKAEEEKRIALARQEAERKAEEEKRIALARQEAERKAEEEKRIALARQEAEQKIKIGKKKLEEALSALKKDDQDKACELYKTALSYLEDENIIKKSVGNALIELENVEQYEKASLFIDKIMKQFSWQEDRIWIKKQKDLVLAIACSKALEGKFKESLDLYIGLYNFHGKEVIQNSLEKALVGLQQEKDKASFLKEALEKFPMYKDDWGKRFPILLEKIPKPNIHREVVKEKISEQSPKNKKTDSKNKIFFEDYDERMPKNSEKNGRMAQDKENLENFLLQFIYPGDDLIVKNHFTLGSSMRNHYFIYKTIAGCNDIERHYYQLWNQASFVKFDDSITQTPGIWIKHTLEDGKKIEIFLYTFATPYKKDWKIVHKKILAELAPISKIEKEITIHENLIKKNRNNLALQSGLSALRNQKQNLMVSKIYWHSYAKEKLCIFKQNIVFISITESTKNRD